MLAWGSANKTVLDPVIKKQKAAIRLVSRAAYNAHTGPLFKKNGILRFEDLYTFSILQFMHTYTCSKLPTSFDETWVLNKIKHPRTADLRNADELYVPRHRLNFAARLPLHLFPKLWNEFDDFELKSTTSADTLKDGLKSYFLNDLSAEVKCNRAFCRDCFPDQL